MAQARFDMPSQVRAGEVFKLRLLVQHPMETGYLLDLNNRRIARNVINDLRCTYLGQEVFRIEPSSGVAAHPLFTFYVTARESGELVFEWADDAGASASARAKLIVID
jgi:sulfur-oxidizing protein SoxZ